MNNAIKKLNNNELFGLINGITGTRRYLTLKGFPHHGEISIFDHQLDVALWAHRFAVRLKLNVDYTALVRGALLHDYYFYNWHDKNKGFRWHGFKHPVFALKNAVEDFCLSEVEKDIISKHMFPLVIKPPRFRESWIVLFADKIVTLKEYLQRFKIRRIIFPSASLKIRVPFARH